MRWMTENPGSCKWASTLRRDDGMALATVVAISMILFLLSSTLVMLATQGQVAASNQAQRTKALAAADAGIDAYVYKLSMGEHPSTLSGSTEESSWTVTVPPQDPGSCIATLTAVGTIPAQGVAPATTRKVVATIRLASFSDYMFLLDKYFNLGSGGLVKGNVRSNDYVNNDGEITGDVYASSYISGSGLFDKSLYPGYKTQSFAVVPYGDLMTMAQADGTYFPDTGAFGSGTSWRHYWGYCVTLSGTGGTVSKVKSIDTGTGAMVIDPTTTRTFTTPADGVLYFDDPVWLSGTYSAKVTVVVGKECTDPGTTRNPYTGGDPGASGMNPSSRTGNQNQANSSVYLWKNLQAQDANNHNEVCGIVTPGDISFTSEYPDSVTPTDLTIQAAMLSSHGSIHADWVDYHVKDHLKIYGTEAMLQQGFIKTTDWWGNTICGFDTRDYWYDPSLDINTPPNFPTLGDGSLFIKSWVEQ
jgi:hypothetical protein